MNGTASGGKGGPSATKDQIPRDAEDSGAVPDRGTWSGRFDFILASLGSAVGLGNVWRFPYLCYKNGGGAFVLPYILMVFLIGLPVFLLELTLGQYSAFGPLKVFATMAPIFKGVGYAMIIAATVVGVYYNMIIAWTLFYFFDSFRSDVQWQYCHHSFNTDKCFSDTEFRLCKSLNSSNVYSNRTCFNATLATERGIQDMPESDRISSSEEYLTRYMLGKSSGIEDLGSIRWQLVVCLGVAWLFVVGCLIKGIKTSGRVVYFTATFPYIILCILFVRGMTLEGAMEGLKFYTTPDFSKLTSIGVWEAAAIQVFYSFSIGGGGMMTYASYNKFNNNLIRDALIIGIGDMLTSLFSGLVVFSMLGFMANQLGKSVQDVVQSGVGLAFIAYPDGIARMPASVLWALLFFFMLFLLGIDSQFAMIETLITFVFDQFPKTRARKPLVVIAIGTILFVAGLPLTTNGGIYVLELMDNYAAGWPYLLIGVLECCIVAYVYGASRFLTDLHHMTGWSPGIWVKSHLLVTIMTISPLLIAVILLLSWIRFKPLSLDNYAYPMWANGIGWAMAIVPVACIPLGVLHELTCRNGKLPFMERLRQATKPTDEWEANAIANTSEKVQMACYDNHGLNVAFESTEKSIL